MFLAFLFNQKRVVLFQKTITTNKISSFFAFVSLSVKPIGFFLVLCCAVFSPFREKAIAAAVRLSKWWSRFWNFESTNGGRFWNCLAPVWNRLFPKQCFENRLFRLTENNKFGNLLLLDLMISSGHQRIRWNSKFLTRFKKVQSACYPCWCSITVHNSKSHFVLKDVQWTLSIDIQCTGYEIIVFLTTSKNDVTSWFTVLGLRWLKLNLEFRFKIINQFWNEISNF